MGKHIINAAWWFGLISLSLCSVNPAAAQVDQQRADAYFKEAAAICQRDDGRLWGVSLCGPMVFADARTRTLATNQPRPTGEQPQTLGFANAPIEWVALGRLRVGLHDVAGCVRTRPVDVARALPPYSARPRADHP